MISFSIDTHVIPIWHVRGLNLCWWNTCIKVHNVFLTIYQMLSTNTYSQFLLHIFLGGDPEAPQKKSLFLSVLMVSVNYNR